MPRARGVEYNNLRSVCGLGHSHRSKLEGAVCELIRLRQLAGEIRLDQVEETVYLTAARYKYIADFRCTDLKTGKPFRAEAKGFPDKRWPTTKKLYRLYGELPLEIWGGSHQRPKLVEKIIPEASGGERKCPKCGAELMP